MKYLIVFLWAFILGQIVSYIGGSLLGYSYQFVPTTIITMIVTVLAIIFGLLVQPEKANSTK